METLFTDLTISMSEFKKNPAKVLRDAGPKPVAVLNHNKPAFYMVEPKMFEALVDKLADIELMPLIKRRYEQRAVAVEVNIDEI